MSILEKKVDALLRFCLCNNEGEKNEVRKDIMDLLSDKKVATSFDLHTRMSTVLLELGVPDSLLGHDYLIYAIEMAVNDPDTIHSITSVLYPEVAKKFNTTASRVERAIRHSIEVAWDRSDLNTILKYFGNTVSPNNGRPTNSEFIARISKVVR